MKFLAGLVFVAFAVAVQALTDEQKANWKKWSESCQKETGISQEDILKLRNNVYTAPDAKIKGQILCFSKKAGLANESGAIQVESVRGKLKRVVTSDEEINRIISKCNIVRDTPEDSVYETFKCIRTDVPNFSPV